MQHLTRSLCSSPITEPSTLLRIVPPQCPTSVRFASWLRPLVLSPLSLERLVPAVPLESLRQIHAPSTPVAVCPVIRYPADLSQRYHSPLILTALLYLRRVIGRFAFARLSDTHLHGLIRTFPPTLTTTTLNRSRLGWFDICL